MAGKVTVGRASHWPFVTDSVTDIIKNICWYSTESTDIIKTISVAIPTYGLNGL